MSSDPNTWGLQPNGWVTPAAAEILENMEDEEHANIKADLDVDADSPVGQLNGIVAAQLGLVWEGLGALEASRTRDGAEDAMLDQLGKLTGSVRDAARATTVVCTVGLDAGTTLTVDHLASIVDHPERTFRPVVDETSGFTAPTTTTYTITFECTEVGALVVSPSTLTVITTPLSGWTSITNPAAGITGALVQSDTDSRLVQEADLTAAGSTTALAIASDLADVPGVLSASVLENITDVTDGNGLPPHSIECVLHTDGTETVSDLVTAIWLAKGAGCATYGSSSAVYTDANGDTHTVYYSLITPKLVYLTYALSTTTGYAGHAATKTAIISAMTARSLAGVDVNAVYTKSIPMTQLGVVDVTGFTLGFAPAPSGTANLAIGIREIATFDASRITIT